MVGFRRKNGSVSISCVARPLVERGVALLEGRSASAGRFHGLIRRVTVLVNCRTLSSLRARSVAIGAPVRRSIRPIVSNGGLTIIPVLHTNLNVMGNVLTLIPSTEMNRVNLCHSPRARRPRRCCYGLPRPVSHHRVIIISPVLTANNSTVTTISFVGGRNNRGVGFVSVVTTPRNISTLVGTRPSVRLCINYLSHRLGRGTCVYPNLNSTNSEVFNAGWFVLPRSGDLDGGTRTFSIPRGYGYDDIGDIFKIEVYRAKWNFPG